MSSKSWSAFLSFLLGCVLAFWEVFRDKKTHVGYWVFLGVLIVGSLLLWIVFAYRDQKSLPKSKEEGLTAEGFGAVAFVSFAVRTYVGWDSMSLFQQRLVFGAGWLVLAAVIAYICFRCYKVVKPQSGSSDAQTPQSSSSSGLLSIFGISSFLIFSFAVKKVHQAHDALAKLRSPDLLNSSSAVDLPTLLQAQTYSSDRMFWGCVALVAFSFAITCLAFKRSK